MARIAYLRAVTAIAAMAAMVAVVVAHGSASAQTPPPGTPFVVSTVPADNATNVDRNTNVTVTFSERMLGSSINGDTVALYKGNFTAQDLNPDPNCAPNCPASPDALPASVNYFEQVVRQRRGKNKRGKRKKPVVRFIPYAALDPMPTPVFALDPNTIYTVLIEGAGDADGLAVKDLAGNDMAADKIVHFRTVDEPVG